MKLQLQLFAFLFLLSGSLLAQSNRYKEAIFPQRDLQSNIQYGMADSYDIFGANIQQPQLLDFYEPSGDTASKRPLVLVFFGGGYLIGDKIMQDMVGWCDSLTAYGYACAAVNYRIGYNVLNSGSAIRAGYRGVQDARAAIRFMKEKHQQYKIDTNLIFLAGNSAGAIISMQVAYGEESNRPVETYGISGTLAESSDLGCMDCSGNNYQHTVDVAGVVGCWGAVIDMGGLDTGDTAPIIMFHGTADNIVPIDSGAAFNSTATFPPIYGSRTVHNARVEMGLESELHVYPGEPHNFYYNGALFPGVYWDTIWQLTHPFLCEANPYCVSNVGVSLVESEPFYELYPNPAEETVNIGFYNKVFGEEKTINVYNLQGQEVENYQTLDNQLKINVADWHTGLYWINIQAGAYQYSQKLVVK